MREIIYDDIATKYRTIMRYEMTQSGVRQTTTTEPIPESDLDETVQKKEEIIFDNYDEVLSTSVGGGYYVYDKTIQTAPDGHKIYGFNDYVITQFDMKFDCNDKGIIDGHFYLSHNIRDVKIYSFEFFEIDKYTEDSKLVIFVEDSKVLELGIAGIINGTAEALFNIAEIVDRLRLTKTKWEIFISGNTNPDARGKLKLGFISTPENGINITDIYSKKTGGD